MITEDEQTSLMHRVTDLQRDKAELESSVSEGLALLIGRRLRVTHRYLLPCICT